MSRGDAVTACPVHIPECVLGLMRLWTPCKAPSALATSLDNPHPKGESGWKTEVSTGSRKPPFHLGCLLLGLPALQPCAGGGCAQTLPRAQY